jgi:hypothetical protein
VEIAGLERFDAELGPGPGAHVPARPDLDLDVAAVGGVQESPAASAVLTWAGTQSSAPGRQ